MVAMIFSCCRYIYPVIDLIENLAPMRRGRWPKDSMNVNTSVRFSQAATVSAANVAMTPRSWSALISSATRVLSLDEKLPGPFQSLILLRCAGNRANQQTPLVADLLGFLHCGPECRTPLPGAGLPESG